MSAFMHEGGFTESFITFISGCEVGLGIDRFKSGKF